MTAVIATRSGFAAVNGTQLYYEERGAGVPVVLVHGFGLDARMWDDQFDVLAERYRVIRYDARGFGRSAPEDGPFRHAEDLHELLRFLDAAPAHLVGLSMGGRIVLQAALLHPHDAASLVLVDSALDGFAWSDEWEASFDAIAGHAAVAGEAGGKEHWLAHELFAPARERAVVGERLAQIVREGSGRHWTHASAARGLDPPAGSRLGEIAVPALVVVGERDLPDFLRIAERLEREIPGARKITLAGAGHMANMEAPDDFNAALVAFIDAARGA